MKKSNDDNAYGGRSRRVVNLRTYGKRRDLLVAESGKDGMLSYELGDVELLACVALR